MKTIELDTDKLVIRKRVPVVTRHKALVAYLLNREIIKEGEFKLIEHATINDVEGRDVIGVLPLHLASYAKTLTEVPLTLPQELRGKELTFEEVAKYSEEPAQYIIRETDSKDGIDYYSQILEGYTKEDYELAYKYYKHVDISKQYFKDYKEIAKARNTYIDIMNCLYGIFDIFTIENSGWREFEFMRINNLRFRCSLVYEDESTPTISIQMVNFDRANILKFIDELINMCL